MSLSAGVAEARFLLETELADTPLVDPRDFVPVVLLEDVPAFLVAAFLVAVFLVAVFLVAVFLVAVFAVFAALADLPTFLVAVFVAIRAPAKLLLATPIRRAPDQ
jgi:hypothetical protein